MPYTRPCTPPSPTRQPARSAAQPGDHCPAPDTCALPGVMAGRHRKAISNCRARSHHRRGHQRLCRSADSSGDHDARRPRTRCGSRRKQASSLLLKLDAAAAGLRTGLDGIPAIALAEGQQLLEPTAWTRSLPQRQRPAMPLDGTGQTRRLRKARSSRQPVSTSR